MLYYKIDILAALREKGFSSYALMQNNVIGSATLQKLRSGRMIGNIELDKICGLLRCQPSRLIGWKPDPPTDKNPASGA